MRLHVHVRTHGYVRRLLTCPRSYSLQQINQAPPKQLQQQRQRVLQLWALLPAFCARPKDTAAAFGTFRFPHVTFSVHPTDPPCWVFMHPHAHLTVPVLTHDHNHFIYL